MRRFVTAALLALFICQSSGAAIAAPNSPTSVTSMLGQIQFTAAQVLSSFRTTHFGALLTGEEARYEAMHQPAPTPIPRTPAIQVAQTRERHWIMPIYRVGMPKDLPGNADRRFSPLEAVRDPHAIGGATQQTGSARLSRSIICLYCRPAYISVPSQMSGTAGSTALGAATCLPANSTLPPSPSFCGGITVASSNAAVATAQFIGLQGGGIRYNITYSYLSPGTATITFTYSGSHATTTVTVSASPTPTPTPTPIPVTPTPAPTPTPVPTLTPSTTGVNRWWTYEEKQIPGIGKAMVNVANGNLLVQSDDMDIPERGIDLAFQRTYNSQSRHDASNSDGSVQGLYGNGWTNTFDAHIEYNVGLNASCPTAQGITMYDIDGARYDFKPDCNGYFISPPGLQGTTMAAYVNGCVYGWQKKSGTFYTFFSPTYGTAACAGAADSGYDGRLHKIYGRNMNNVVVLTYSWLNGDATNANNITAITAAHSDGQKLTLQFALFNGHDELHSVTRNADGQSTTYWYDNDGNLTDVCDIGNGSSTAASSPCAAGQIHYQYAYNANSYQMAWVNSPNWVMTNYECGTYQSYGYDGSNRVTSLTDTGTANPYIADGSSGGSVSTGCSASGSVLQPNYAPNYGGTQAQYLRETLGYSGGLTTLTDTDGHSTKWSFDGIGRVTETQELTGAPNNLWLTTYASWDGNNNLTESVDARGYATDYGYDGNGNTIWVQQPWITTSMGYGRPVARYSYDQYNNLIAYCDPQYIWTSGVSNCTAGSGVAHYTWSSDTSPDPNEPSGCLTDTYTALGYHRHISYGGSSTCGSSGLPLIVQGDPVSQPTDRTTPMWTPTQTYVYNGYGDLVQYSRGNGVWNLAYDVENRMLSATDPDGVSSYTCYYADGQTQYTESAPQHTLDGVPASCQSSAPAYATAYTYDADGNRLTVTHHFGGAYSTSGTPTLPATAGVTRNYYDGADRLVEVVEPTDPSDVFSNPWITRYIYDLSQGGVAGALPTIGGVAITAHGNLYKTQELLPSSGTALSTSWIPPTSTSPAGVTKLSNTVFTDIKGTGYDALDRPTTQYRFVNGTLEKELLTYDATPTTYGFLQSDCNALQQCKTLNYDTEGNQTTVTFSDGKEPNQTTSFDPDGRAVNVSQTNGDSQTRTFDADGRIATSVQSGNFPGSPVTLTYHYYDNGPRSQLDVNSSTFTQSGLFQYGYRPDGALEVQTVNAPFDPKVGSVTIQNTYSSAGRTRQRVDSGSLIGTWTTTYSNDPTSGLETSIAYPAGTLQNFEYDPEGELLGYTSSSDPGDWFSYTYSTRGEQVQAQANGPGYSGSFGSYFADTYYANGTSLTVNQVRPGNVYSGTSVESWVWKWDAAQGVLTGSSGLTTGGTTCSIMERTMSAGFDAAGRETGAASTSQPANTHNCPNVMTAVQTAPTYDDENHVVSSSASVNPPVCCGASWPNWNFAYTWGANGHPELVGSSASGSSTLAPSPMAYDTAHWDGDQMLFTTNSSGQIDDLKVGDIGDITPTDATYSGLTFWDRGPDNTIAYYHNAAGTPSSYFSGSLFNNPGCGTTPCPTGMIFTQSWSSAGSQFKGIGHGNLLTLARTDGYTDGYTTIQGYRAYDATIGAWTTPDAYQGDVVDPMSQKSYMWNNNNPVAYSDPSGYCATDPYSAKNDPCLPSGVGRDHIHQLQQATNTLDAIGRNAFMVAIPGAEEAGAAKILESAAQDAVEGVARTAGETAAAAYGRFMHAMWDYGPGFEKEFRLANGRRADAVNLVTREVVELKPNNPAAIAKGLRQVRDYAQQLDRQFPGTPFTYRVETYDRP